MHHIMQKLWRQTYLKKHIFVENKPVELRWQRMFDECGDSGSGSKELQFSCTQACRAQTHQSIFTCPRSEPYLLTFACYDSIASDPSQCCVRALRRVVKIQFFQHSCTDASGLNETQTDVNICAWLAEQLSYCVCVCLSRVQRDGRPGAAGTARWAHISDRQRE